MIQLKSGQELARTVKHEDPCIHFPRCVCILEKDKVVLTDAFGEEWIAIQLLFEYQYKGGLWLVPWKTEKHPITYIVFEPVDPGGYQGIRYNAELARSLANAR